MLQRTALDLASLLLVGIYFVSSSWPLRQSCNTYFLLHLFIFERQSTSRGGVEREGDTDPKQAPGSQLSAQSPMRGSNSQTARSWPEPKSDAQPAEPPRCPKAAIRIACAYIGVPVHPSQWDRRPEVELLVSIVIVFQNWELLFYCLPQIRWQCRFHQTCLKIPFSLNSTSMRCYSSGLWIWWVWNDIS